MAMDSKNVRRKKRHLRVRKNLSGTAQKPRLSVFRSNKNISAQLIDDEAGVTLCSASSLEKDLKAGVQNTSNKEAAKKVGMELGKRATEKGIKDVCFDRSGYLYFGRVKELAEGAREAGLNF